MTALGIGAEWTAGSVIATLERAWLQARHLATYSESPRAAASQLDSLVVIFDGMSPFHQGGRIERIVAGGDTLSADSALIASLSAALQGEFFWSLFLSDSRTAVDREGRVELDVVAGTARILDLSAPGSADPRDEGIRGVAHLAADTLEDAWDHARKMFHPRKAVAEIEYSHIEDIVLRFGVPGHFPKGGAIEHITVDGVRLAEISSLIPFIQLLTQDDRWGYVLTTCHWDLDGLGGSVVFTVSPINARVLSRSP